MVGAKIAEQYTKEELGIIIAQISIGNAIKSFDIKLTGEQGMESKSRGSKNSRGRNFDRRGRGSRDRNSRGRNSGRNDRRSNSSSNRRPRKKEGNSSSNNRSRKRR